MPLPVASVFAAAGLEPAGAVRWGTPVPQNASGIYVVALTDDPRSTTGALPVAPLARAALEHLLSIRPELRLDGVRPSVDALADRLHRFWLPDEVVLYIGLAGTSVRKRVRQYYTTLLGARRPHAGGWWLKTLTVLDELWVHWAATSESDIGERTMLTAFVADVSPASCAALHDGARVAPFANLRAGSGHIKQHGVTGATGESEPSGRTDGSPPGGPVPGRDSVAERPAAARKPLARATAAGDTPTQRITAKDFGAGRIRLPARSKHLLPRERADVHVLLRGHRLRARWDPRMGRPERSGVLGFGRGTLNGLVEVDEVLDVATGTDNGVELT